MKEKKNRDKNKTLPIISITKLKCQIMTGGLQKNYDVSM